MKFCSVPIQIQREILKLTTDEEFQERFANDEVLNQLDALKYDSFIQYNELLVTALHSDIKLNGKSFKPITLALWSYLYIIKSPIIFEDKKISMVDLDMFFYLLETKNFASLNEVLQKSMNYCNTKLPLTGQQIKTVFQNLLKISFRALNMFPKYRFEGAKPAFNVDWMTSIATKV